MPVGSYPKGVSPSGALDMAGNVKEWVSDWYYPYYYGISPRANPLGPSTGREKSVRGGSFDLGADLILTSSRHKFDPSENYDNIGFRCVMR
jgi:formylglycine-generating enzyme required for sulfatase activity